MALTPARRYVLFSDHGTLFRDVNVSFALSSTFIGHVYRICSYLDIIIVPKSSWTREIYMYILVIDSSATTSGHLIFFIISSNVYIIFMDLLIDNSKLAAHSFEPYFVTFLPYSIIVLRFMQQ